MFRSHDISHDSARPFWRIFANPTRRAIVELLELEPRTTGDLCRFFDLSRFAIMQHLKLLEETGIITVKREGRYRWNHLDGRRLSELRLALSDNSAWLAHNDTNRTAHAQLALAFEYPLAADRLFALLVDQIAQWWFGLNEPDAARIMLDARPGGQLSEKIGDGGVVHALVDRYLPPHALGFSGTCGLPSTLSLVRLQLNSADRQTTVLQLQHGLFGVLMPTLYDDLRRLWTQRLDERLRALLPVA